MKYDYFISYSFKDRIGNECKNNTVLHADKKIDCYSDIEKITRQFRHIYNSQQVIIISFQLLKKRLW